MESLPYTVVSAHPTIVDVAQRAGTTAATVSRVLNNSGYVRASTRAAVLRAVNDIAYVPNANARALKTRRSTAIGLVVGDLLNPYAITLANSVQAAAAARGYTVFIAAAGDEVASELAVVDAFVRQRLAGLIVASLPSTESDHRLQQVADRGVHLVLVGRTLDHPRVDSISANYRRGGLAATRHLIELGHRRIGCIGARVV